MVWVINSCTTSFYVVRHADKSTSPKNDPVLTETGSQRAKKLKTLLEKKRIQRIFSTQTVRAVTTAKPLSDPAKLNIEIYNPKNQTDFIETLKKTKQNTLVVGHGNTIRYIINGSAAKEVLSKDLEDTEYTNLYLVKEGNWGSPW